MPAAAARPADGTRTQHPGHASRSNAAVRGKPRSSTRLSGAAGRGVLGGAGGYLALRVIPAQATVLITGLLPRWRGLADSTE